MTNKLCKPTDEENRDDRVRRLDPRYVVYYRCLWVHYNGGESTVECSRRCQMNNVH